MSCDGSFVSVYILLLEIHSTSRGKEKLITENKSIFDNKRKTIERTNEQKYLGNQKCSTSENEKTAEFAWCLCVECA